MKDFSFPKNLYIVTKKLVLNIFTENKGKRTRTMKTAPKDAHPNLQIMSRKYIDNFNGFHSFEMSVP